ncbi:hypothetical protein B0T14DRAFT_607880 [Immersiella caudata]|uniref:Uncharacterized protein n=1 Tax=Immersiella caudata TaxID=314043 RepID=A0AA39TNV6_9PEZI|nr:hypothetical protein B0T14DRAFT_607880 [Immersiella caudata]
MIGIGATSKSPGSAPPSPRVLKKGLKWTKVKILWLPVALSVISTVTLITTGWYVYDTMVVENPPPHLVLSASNANLLVSVLSQVFAMTLAFLFSEVFDYFRWQLAATSRGVSAATFFTLSSATSRIPISVFTASRWLLSWGVIW